MSVEAFTKVVRPGVLAADGDVFVEVDWDGTRLAITGVEGPKANGDCLGSSGQIVLGYRTREQRDRIGLDVKGGWTRPMLDRLFDVWGRWHMNDLRAGSPRQEQHLRDHPIPRHVPGGASFYERAVAALSSAGLQPDAQHLVDGRPYFYGSAWLTEDVPEDVLTFLRDLPESSKKYPWPWGKKQ